jgi:hypothetical protein
MSRKDYILIAKVIRDRMDEVNSDEQKEQREMRVGSAREQFEIAENARRYELNQVAEYFSRRLTNTNARFDSQRFLAACGVSGGN